MFLVSRVASRDVDPGFSTVLWIALDRAPPRKQPLVHCFIMLTIVWRLPGAIIHERITTWLAVRRSLLIHGHGQRDDP